MQLRNIGRIKCIVFPTNPTVRSATALSVISRAHPCLLTYRPHKTTFYHKVPRLSPNDVFLQCGRRSLRASSIFVESTPRRDFHSDTHTHSHTLSRASPKCTTRPITNTAGAAGNTRSRKKRDNNSKPECAAGLKPCLTDAVTYCRSVTYLTDLGGALGLLLFIVIKATTLGSVTMTATIRVHNR